MTPVTPDYHRTKDYTPRFCIITSHGGIFHEQQKIYLRNHKKSQEITQDIWGRPRLNGKVNLNFGIRNPSDFQLTRGFNNEVANQDNTAGF